MSKQRVDEVLVARGLAATVAEAQRLCIAGEVSGAGERLSKPGMLVDPSTPLQVRDQARFVSRGGHKLDGALERFGLSVRGLRCLDIGASTGGFTDCLLQRGAASVAAVDVGYGQLSWRLRSDARVAVFERTNIRLADPIQLGAPFDLAVADLSFTALSGLLAGVEELLVPQGSLIALIKPQFELAPDEVGTGVVTAADLHEKAVRKVLDSLPAAGFAPRGLCYSPIKGQKGNIEFLVWAQRDTHPATINVKEVVQAAHEALG
jgi:23S rRNA (cytidine1920-2'-O)/16S rRNA (cytidine1409-2'-O)-methyltransferase